MSGARDSSSGASGRRPSVATVLLDLLAGGSPALEAHDGNPDAWRALASEAERRAVDPMLHAALAQAAAGTVPDDVRSRLAQCYARNALRNRLMTIELHAVLAGLEQRGIMAMPLKGVCLAPHVYRDPGLRYMGDIDLMVRRAHLAGARDVLLELGYHSKVERSMAESCARSHHLPPFLHARATPIELHWNIVPPSSPLHIDVHAIWTRSVPAQIAGVDVRRQSAEDLILHLCVHAGFSHQWYIASAREFPLRAIVDIAATVRALGSEIDWERLCRLATSSNAVRFVHTGLAVSQRLLGSEVPSSALKALRLDDAADAKVDELCQILTTRSSFDLPSTYRLWLQEESVSSWLRAVAETLFPGKRRLLRSGGAGRSYASLYLRHLSRLPALARREAWAMARLLRAGGKAGDEARREAMRARVRRWVASG